MMRTEETQLGKAIDFPPLGVWFLDAAVVAYLVINKKRSSGLTASIGKKGKLLTLLFTTLMPLCLCPLYDLISQS